MTRAGGKLMKRMAVTLGIVVGVFGLSVVGVATVGSPAEARCAAANGQAGSGTAGGAGGVRCPKGATTIFTDDFLQEPATAFCWTTLANWNLTPAGGNVDVFTPGSGASGQVVDLDGSANICGGDGTPVMTLKTPITVVAGRTYTASFRISTNPSPFASTLPDTNSVNVVFGPASGTFTKQASEQGAYTTETLSFVAAANGTASLSFEEVGAADRGGITLDTVTITES